MSENRTIVEILVRMYATGFGKEKTPLRRYTKKYSFDYYLLMFPLLWHEYRNREKFGPAMALLQDSYNVI